MNQICKPLLMSFRKLLSNLGGLDLSPIFALLTLGLINMLVINSLAAMAGMLQQLSIFLRASIAGTTRAHSSIATCSPGRTMTSLPDYTTDV